MMLLLHTFLSDEYLPLFTLSRQLQVKCATGWCVTKDYWETKKSSRLYETLSKNERSATSRKRQTHRSRGHQTEEWHIIIWNHVSTIKTVWITNTIVQRLLAKELGYLSMYEFHPRFNLVRYCIAWNHLMGRSCEHSPDRRRTLQQVASLACLACLGLSSSSQLGRIFMDVLQTHDLFLYHRKPFMPLWLALLALFPFFCSSLLVVSKLVRRYWSTMSGFHGLNETG